MTQAEVAARDLDALKAVVGPKGYIEDETEKAPYLVDIRDLVHGRSPLILRPQSTAEVSAVMKLCHQAEIAVVPQGGNTGHVAGGVPQEGGGEVVLSLSRLRQVRAVDPVDYSITVEAGCILAEVQAAAAAVDRLFPLSLAAEGSCQIGGNLSTNAGGIAVLRYGNARDLVLGLEVVLPDGTVWDGLRRLRKDNRGYDLKQLFLGAEGTLGVITAAVLKLFPRPKETATALMAVKDPEAAVHLLADFRATSGDWVTSFEYMNRACLDLVVDVMPGCRDPLAEPYTHYVLVELAAGEVGAALQEAMEGVIGRAFEAGAVLDAAIAASEGQAQALWQLRESLGEAQKKAGGCIKHDISVPVSQVPAFLARAEPITRAEVPGCRLIPFGHIGDGNLHYNLVQAPGDDRAAFLGHAEALAHKIHDLVAEFGGSFSAEHGVGRIKRQDLRHYKSETELAMMTLIKRAFDPKGIMNPGKVL